MESFCKRVFKAIQMILYIDFGGTNFRYCYDDGEIFVSKSDKVDFIEFLENEIKQKPDLQKISISFAGQVKDGKILSSPNIALHNLDIKKQIYDRYKVAVLLENDLNAAAIYEYSKFKQAKTMAVFYIGTGFGSAFVIDGKIFGGANNLSGEIGHIPFKRVDKVCGCGRNDCLELSVSGKALDGLRLDECDESIKQTFLDGLRHSFFTVLNLFDPDYFALGGSVVLNNSWIADFLEESFDQSSFSSIRKKPIIYISDSQNGNIEGLKILTKDLDGQYKTNG